MTERRYKDPEEYSMDEVIEIDRARRAGRARPKFERDEYRRGKAEALREAGFSDEADELDRDAAGEPAPGMDGEFARVRKHNPNRKTR